jgi:addiction module RelE/StbE family toxin
VSQRVAWTPASLRDLATIQAYLERFNPHAAASLFERLLTAGNSLADHAERGRDIGRGRRELVVVYTYLIGYRVEGDLVHIIRIRHGARQPEG